MSKSPATKRSALTAWSTEILRLTAFHQLGVQKGHNDWWESVTGSQPESKNLKPREGGYEVAGPFANGVLTLRADVARFDWILSGAVSMDKPLTTFPLVGSLQDAMGSFMPLMQAWLPTAPPINRIAFGAVWQQQVSDRVAGYRLLDAYLPFVELDAEKSSDFLYQINRHHTASEFGQMHINRIARWSVALMQPVTIALGAGKPPTSVSTGESVSALRLELDINTDATRTEPLSPNTLASFYKYLAKLGTEFAEKGDIK